MNEEQIKQAHNKYIELGSLNKTCAWILEEFSIKLSRQKLSKIFRRRDLYVKTRTNQYTLKILEETTTKIEDPVLNLGAELIQRTWDDIKAYKNPRKKKAKYSQINYLSACWFVAKSPLYLLIITALYEAAGVKYTKDMLHAVPEWFSQEELNQGAKEYLRKLNIAMTVEE